MLRRAHAWLSGPGLGPLLARSVVGTGGVRAAGMGLAFLAGIQLARGLGLAGYGVYGIAMSAIALLSVPTEFGLPQLVVREVAKAPGDPATQGAIVRWARNTSLLLWLPVCAGVLGWAWFAGRTGIARELSASLVAGLLMIPFVAMTKINGSLLRGLQHIVLGQVPDALVRPAAFSILLFAASLLAAKLTPPLAVLAAAGAAVCAYLACLAFVRRRAALHARRAPAAGERRAWLASSLPMGITESMRVLQGSLVVLLLGLVATTVTVGTFRTANSVMLIVSAPLTVFTLVVAPIISRLYAAAEHARLQQLLTWTTGGMMACALAVSAPLFVFGHFFLSEVFGEQFAVATRTLQILCVGAVFTASAGTAGILLNMTKYERRVTRASLIAMVVLVLLLPPLAYFYRAEGAAVANVASMLAWRSLMVSDCRKYLQLDTTILPLFSRANLSRLRRRGAGPAP